MVKYNRLPLKKLGITGTWQEHTSRGSRGIDFGYFDYQGEDVYAMNDGVVDQIDKSTGTNNAGVYVWIKHEYTSSQDIWSRYCHLKEGSVCVKVGQKVTRGQKIAQMGGTYGYATHLHFETWVVPKGYQLNWNDRTKYAVNPLEYVYLFDNQSVGSSASLITKVVGSSHQATRNTSKNQIQVVGYQLRCRAGAGTNQSVVGYIDYGIYDYSETKDSGGYTWYHVYNGWIAGIKEDTIVYPKQNPTPPIPDDKDKKIVELQKQVYDSQETIKKQDTDLLAQKSLIEEQTKKIEELNDLLGKYSNLKTFEALNKGLYYIYLEKNEKVYF